MARKIEAQGVTVEEAIQVALNRLGVSRDQVEIEIVHHPRRGLFGIGARRAKVCATMRETRFVDGEEFEIADGGKRRRGRRGRRSGKRRGGSRQGQAGDQGSEREVQRAQPQRTPRGRQRNGSAGKGPEQRPAPRKDDVQRERRADNTQRRERGEPNEREQEHRQRQEVTPVDIQNAAPPAAAERPPAKPALTADRAGVRAVEIVRELMERMGFEASVELGNGDGPEEILVQIRCDAEGLLIGRHGQTLDSVEHIVNRMVLSGESTDLRVVLDVGGYRDRRRESLIELADRLKVRAMTQGRRVQVSPMSPRDRRVFQGALASDDSVFTRVLGSGFYRRVMIVPVGLEDDDSPIEEIRHDAPHETVPASETEKTG